MNWQPPAKRPYLLVTPAILDQVRFALETGHAPTRAAFRQCEVLAQQAREMELPSFNNTWFIGLQRSDWERTWNDEWLHTWKTPGVLAEPALGAALHYAITGARASLQGAKRILQHALGFSFGASHFDIGLYYTFWCLPLLFAYDGIYPALSPEERSPLEDWFAAFAAAVRANDNLWVKEILGGKLNNHYAWHKWACGVYGLHSGQAELVEYAIDGPMGYREMLEQGLRDEGLWLECSTGYNFSIHRPLTMLCWSLRNAGWPEDLFKLRYANGLSLLDMYLAPLYWLFPDDSVPNVGDCYGKKASLPATEYAYAWVAYGDPRLAWVITSQQLAARPLDRLILTEQPAQVEAPAVVTRDWPEHGYALLTTAEPGSYFDVRTAACFVTFGYSGIHGHQDKLSFELHALGERWIADAEGEGTTGNAFLSAIERELGRSTLAHNTVMVDQRSQHSIGHNLASTLNAQQRRLIITDVSELYPGLSQERELQLSGHALSDTFTLKSADEHMYDYVLHLLPGCEVELPLALEVKPPFTELPYS